jgi:hypothetical protein
MDCRTYRKNLEDYLEGGLDFPGRFGMERHAQECICCGKELSDAQKLRTMAHELRRVTAPPDFEAQVLRRIRAEGRRNPFWHFSQNWIHLFSMPSRRVLAFSASGLVILAGFGLFVSYRPQQNNAPAANPVAAISKPEPNAIPQTIASPQLNAVPVKSASVAKPSKKQETAPLALIPRHSEGDDSALSNPEPIYAEAADQDVVGLPVPGLGSSQHIMLLPKALKVRNEPSSEEYFIRNVSH